MSLRSLLLTSTFGWGFTFALAVGMGLMLARSVRPDSWAGVSAPRAVVRAVVFGVGLGALTGLATWVWDLTNPPNWLRALPTAIPPLLVLIGARHDSMVNRFLGRRR
jgi:hypothetical protein